jgi:hypothetical protein
MNSLTSDWLVSFWPRREPSKLLSFLSSQASDSNLTSVDNAFNSLLRVDGTLSIAVRDPPPKVCFECI